MFADGMTEDKQVKLLDIASRKLWTVFVPDALMKDVVQPYFGEQVEISGKRAARQNTLPSTLFLIDIQKIKADSKP